MQRPDKRRLFLILVSSIVLVDRVTKWIVQETLNENARVSVLGSVVRLTHIYNPGAAFGISLGDSSREIFIALTVAALLVLVSMYRATPTDNRTRLASIAMVCGGAIGNLVDRIRTPRGVLDFIDIGIGNYRWPVFNVADIAVTTGALLLALSLSRRDHESETAS